MSLYPRLSVLIVEDDPEVAQVNAAYVQAAGSYDVIGVASSIQEARRLIKAHHPDITLLDVQLPDGDGLHLLAQARAEGWIQDAVMLTAARDAASVATALSGGVSDYLIKPFSAQRLQAALHAVRTRREAMQGGAREFNQRALDRLLGHDAPPAAHLLKRVDAHTLSLVREVLRRNEAAYSAEEVGRALGINRATAWRYLEQLTDQGEAALDMAYGSVGRPTKKYRWQPQAAGTKPT